jgi:hypothetical protein
MLENGHWSLADRYFDTISIAVRSIITPIAISTSFLPATSTTSIPIVGDVTYFLYIYTSIMRQKIQILLPTIDAISSRAATMTGTAAAVGKARRRQTFHPIDGVASPTRGTPRLRPAGGLDLSLATLRPHGAGRAEPFSRERT